MLVRGVMTVRCVACAVMLGSLSPTFKTKLESEGPWWMKIKLYLLSRGRRRVRVGGAKL